MYHNPDPIPNFFLWFPKIFLLLEVTGSYSFFCKYSPQQNCRFEIQIKIT